ncbi:MAG: sigma 54-interacting transcriptional regulator [Marinisporobacter sp.]|jgi:transcriptional regulator with PAS, ATPase and Fis domain|nr:sigma 54-interacting transcriptional regulator [Marinisporobacter sp.]
MTKKVVIITFFKSVAKLHSEHLKKLFGKDIEIACYSYDMDHITEIINADVVVVSLYSIYVAVKKYISPKAKVVILSSTITKDQYKKIMEVNEGTKAMLVNYSAEMTFETIALLDQIGIDHVEFVPVYPGVMNTPNLDVAVTPGEPQCVPDSVKKVIDIGHRVLDINTMVNIAMKLNMEYLLQEKHFIDHFENLMTPREGITALLGKANTLESRLHSLLNVMEDGIIVIDIKGTVYACNKKAQEIIEYKGEILGRDLSSVVSQVPFKEVLYSSKPIENKLIKIKGQDITITIVPVITIGKITGALVIMNRFEEKEKKQHKLRAQLRGKGHRAKYSFEDIIGESNAIIEIKRVAERMAKSDSSVLITGESGTGKELFAQAIHNDSKRKAYQFVAINCAALPESLLESELFGYEEGAFTGAKKGGKLGLFELAHSGTLFLDEIGEMALNLQARLLRVIQEREVMRIGGDSVIKIDTRIIAATNKNLRELVDQGKFRKDLYYRLNVLPLEIIPLRERKEDIILLCEYMKKKIGVEFSLSEEAQKAFKNYSWDGNLRELKNYVEYLAHLDKSIIQFSDLPKVIRNKKEVIKLDDFEKEKILKFKKQINIKEGEYIFVLGCLENSFQQRTRIGRRSIVKIAEEKGIFLSEGEIRKILLVLEEYNMAVLSNGRGGTQITKFGIKIFNYLNRDKWGI